MPFDDQDRALWNESQIDEGRALLRAALRLGNTGPYVVQAAIADVALATAADWAQIAALLRDARPQTGSAVVRLNHAIAVAEFEGPDAGLAILDQLDLITTGTSTPPGRTCSNAPAAPPKPAARTNERWNSRTRSPSAASSKIASPT